MGRLVVVLLATALATITLVACAFGKTTSMGDVSPFKTLKIGSRNVTKYTRHVWMDKVSFKKWDGVIELYMGPTPIRKGDRLKYKLKKGYKVKFYVNYEDSKGKYHRKRIKNKGKLPACGTNYVLEAYLSKGKYHAPLCLYPYDDYDDDYEDDDYDEY